MLPNLLYEIFHISFYTGLFDIINLIFIFPLFYIFVNNLIKNKVKGIDTLLFSILLIITLISSIHSFNPFIAILGSFRKDGFITLLLYFLVYVNSKTLDKKSVKDIINIVLIIGFINFIYAFIQSYLPINILSSKSFKHMGYGLMGNPNFYGTFMLMISILSLGLYLYKNKRIYFISFITSYIGLILSSSSGPFISFIISMIILFISFKNKYSIFTYIKHILTVVLLYVLVTTTVIFINRDVYLIDISDSYTISGNIKQFKDGIFQNKLFENLDMISSGRLTLWKKTIKYIDNNNLLLLGCGPDNFNMYSVIEKEGKIVGFYHDDKAHNIYLNMVVETGIFSLIIFLIWIFIYHKKIIKSKNIFLYILLFALIGYNIQGIFNINVIYVMVYYYIFVGIGLGDLNETRIN